MERTLTQGNALKNIVLFSIPFLLANLLQTLYGMVDLFVVGQLNGVASLSGVSISSQVMHLLTVMIIGLGMGMTSPFGSLLSAAICVSVYFVMRCKGMFGTAESKRSDPFAFVRH